MSDVSNVPEGAGDTGAVIDAIERLGGFEVVEIGAQNELGRSIEAMVIPAGKVVRSVKPFIDEWREMPERIRAAAVVTTAESFTSYVNRFRRDETAVFVNVEGAPSLLGVVDYHGEGPSADPSFCTHTVTYNFPLSDAMSAWVKATKAGWVDQEEFAYFLEEREFDIISPPADWSMLEPDELGVILDLLNIHGDRNPVDDDDAAALAAEGKKGGDEDGEDRYVPRRALYKFGSSKRMMDLARGIAVGVGRKAVSTYNPRTGEKNISFSEEHETRDATGSKVVVPELFLVNIPVFDGGARHLLPVRLGYRVKGGSVKWAVELIDAPRLIRSAVDAVAAEVGQGTGCPVYYGKPWGIGSTKAA